VAPVAWYGHAQGCSVTGGYVYRGTQQPLLAGLYIYADYCTGNIWAMPAGGGDSELIAKVNVNISSFAEDQDGELYVLADGNGALFRVVGVPR
jgi:hypothetical protein